MLREFTKNFPGARRSCAISFVSTAWTTGLGGGHVVCLCEARQCPRSLSATMLDAFDLRCIIKLLSQKKNAFFLGRTLEVWDGPWRGCAEVHFVGRPGKLHKEGVHKYCWLVLSAHRDLKNTWLDTSRESTRCSLSADSGWQKLQPRV